MSSPAADDPPATLTPAQTEAYLTHLRLPPPSHFTSPALPPAQQLANLQRLIRAHLARVPFENLTLHTSPPSPPELSPAHLFRKIVASGANRGGYCFEANTLFQSLLRALGYALTPVGARVSTAAGSLGDFHARGDDAPPARFLGWNHAAALVRVGGRRHLVDVGFGTNSPTLPVPLAPSGAEARATASSECRLAREGELWVYSVRFDGGSGAWIPCYAFAELEFSMRDFEVMNWATGTHPDSFFVGNLFCSVLLLGGGEEGGEVVGERTLFGGEVKERKGKGKSVVLKTFQGVQERDRALEEFFGIKML